MSSSTHSFWRRALNKARGADSLGVPNIVLILADDLGYGDLSSYGAKDLRSPHTDRLVSRGMRIDNFYANCPVCSPTRAALLSGRYPGLVGVPGVIRTYANNNWGFLDPEAVLLSRLLKDAGYKTAIIGKWQPGPKQLNLYDDVMIPEPDTLFDDYEGRASPAHTQAMTIARHLSKFDLKLVPPRNLTPEQLATWNKAYEPKKIKPDSTRDDIVLNLDFGETFLDAAGAAVPKEMQGCSSKPMLLGGDIADWRKQMYYHYYEFSGPHSVRRHYGVRTNRYKLIYYYRINEWELFDLDKDPQEMKRVYADPAYAKIVADLKKQLAEFRKHYKDDGTMARWPRSTRRRRTKTCWRP